jgi:hypothetical protein
MIEFGSSRQTNAAGAGNTGPEEEEQLELQAESEREANPGCLTDRRKDRAAAGSASTVVGG